MQQTVYRDRDTGSVTTHTLIAAYGRDRPMDASSLIYSLAAAQGATLDHMQRSVTMPDGARYSIKVNEDEDQIEVWQEFTEAL